MNSIVFHPRLHKPSGSHAVQVPLCINTVQKLPIVSILLICLLAGRCHAFGSSDAESNTNWNRAWQSSQLARRVARHASPYSIKVQTSSHNAPRDYDNATNFYNKDVNLLTVAVRASEPIGLVKVSLPARQQCYAAGQVCAGYTFSEGRDQELWGGTARPSQVSPCDLVSVTDMGSGGSSPLDVLSAGMVTACTVNNKVGDYGPRAKRSMMKLYLQEYNRPGNVEFRDLWLVFRIKVRNPPETPVKLDDEGRTANTFQVILKSQAGSMFLGSRVIPAGPIFSIWTCGYSQWIRSSACTADCGGGARYLVRRLLHPPPPGYPVELLINCDQGLTHMEPCSTQPCDQDCQLGEWTSFPTDGDCSTTCGSGQKVERRRIVQGPVGSGEPCPDWNSDARVRLKHCELQPCAEPRCDLASPDDMNGYLVTKCSEVCGEDSTFQVLPVAVYKEREATMEHCKQEWKTLPCPRKKCEAALHFSPYDWNKLPTFDTWVDMELAFGLAAKAQELHVLSPPGFRIGADSNGRCILKEHNFPRFKDCFVIHDEEGETHHSGRMNLNFLNPLEGNFDGKTVIFKVRLWVKPPPKTDCRGMDSIGACQQGEAFEKDWLMQAKFRSSGEYYLEQIKGRFVVYDDSAKMREVRARDHLPPTVSTSLVQLHSRKKKPHASS